MKQRIVAIVSFKVSLSLLEELEKYIIVMVSQSHHQWTPSKVVKGALDAFVHNKID